MSAHLLSDSIDLAEIDKARQRKAPEITLGQKEEDNDSNGVEDNKDEKYLYNSTVYNI